MNKKKLLLVCIMFFIALYTARVCYVNFNYKKPRIITYDRGEICQYGDFLFCMQTKEFKTYGDIKQTYGSITMSNEIDDDETFLVVGFDVTYNGNEERENPKISGICFQSGSWSNGEEYPMLALLNPDGIDIKMDETKRIYLAASLNWQTFAKSDFPRIRNRQYNMTLSTYPDVIRMRCE